MKRKILSLVSCLLMGAATTMASNELVIHFHSGSTQRFVLLDEEPVITFADDNIIVKTTTSEVTYTMEEVNFFDYENSTPTAIGTVGDSDGMLVTGDRIVFNGLPAGSKIQVYATRGQLYLTATADANGHAELSLTTLPVGVYIVKAHQISTKITKK